MQLPSLSDVELEEELSKSSEYVGDTGGFPPGGWSLGAIVWKYAVV